jgi:simple sugar transport system ATP-binding protein
MIAGCQTAGPHTADLNRHWAAQDSSCRPVVSAVGLSKTFNATRALRDVSVQVYPGEVRALVGRNGAGKSTLVSILTGLLEPDAGTIQISGAPAPAMHARELWQSKVACVYQHSKLIPTLSCAENLFLSANMRQRKLVSWRRMRDEAHAAMAQWGLEIDTDLPAGSLTVGQRQMLEIARALNQGSRFLILDEPTAKLDGIESERLFEHLRALRSSGVGILYISHHLDEIFDLCGSVTVLRDGLKTLDRPIVGLGRDELIEAMVGSSGLASAPQLVGGRVDAFNGAHGADVSVPGQPAASVATQPSRLEVRELTCSRHFEKVSFTMHAGECLGLAGLAGSGKEEIGEVLAGLMPRDGGAIFLDGVELPAGDVWTHNRAGIGFVPQDRHCEGLVLGMSVAENATMTIPDRLGSFGFIHPGTQSRISQQLIETLQIKTAGPLAPVSDLSGGNQQKVVLARALARDPRVLVLINPTSGVDVASKETLFASIRAGAQRGGAVLVISDELEELALCQRVRVIRARRLTKEFVAPWSDRALVAEMEGVGT